MFFLFFSNVDIQFAEKSDLNWKKYTATEVLLITNRVKSIDKKELAKTALDKNAKIFIVNDAALMTFLIYYSQEI